MIREMKYGSLEYGIDEAIRLLKNIKKELTEFNLEHRFHRNLEIAIYQHRDLDPVRTIGFEQKGPDILSIEVKDYRNQGKYLGI